MARSIAVTFDYRCPFARNAHEAVVAAVRDGTDVDFRYLAFSLDQIHVPEDEPPVWERPPDERGTGVLALTWGTAVRDRFADHFLDFHIATFAARFDEGRKIGREDVLRDVAKTVGLDPDAVAAEVESGRPLANVASEHDHAVQSYDAFGVPTFIEGDQAVFIRFMERGRVDDLERALDLLDWTRLNEFKRTRVPR